MTLSVSAAVEGLLDEAVLLRLATSAGFAIGTVYGREGKEALRRKIEGYNRAARFYPWVVLVDLNHQYDCPPALLADWLPDPAPLMSLRVAVRKIESWLLADRKAMAKFLGVSLALLPIQPDLEPDPKMKMVNLARRSRFPSIRRDLVPTQESRRQVGPAYTSRVIDFVFQLWDPRQAANVSPSLKRCLIALGRLSS